MADTTTMVKTAKTTKEDLTMKKTDNYDDTLELNQDSICDENVEEFDIHYEVTDEYVIKYSKSRAIGNINISDDRKFLTADDIITVWAKHFKKGSNNKPRGFVSKSKLSTTATPIQIPLEEISVEKLKRLRRLHRSKRLKKPMFLFKEYGRYYLAQIPEKMSFMATGIFDDVHLCKNCSHLSARPVEKGGCEKVFDTYKAIENYIFIDIGYQTFTPCSRNMEVCCICKCDRYEESEPRANRITFKQKHSIIESLKDSIKEFK